MPPCTYLRVVKVSRCPGYQLSRALAGTNKYSSVTRRVEKLLHALPWPNCSREEDLFRLNFLEATSRSALVDRAPRRGQGAPETRRGAKVWQS
jgi:hypothetical protein